MRTVRGGLPGGRDLFEAAENDGTVQAGPRYAKIYQIHKTRCIFCGYCEEACPVSAIFMGKDYELAVYSSKDFIWDKTDLLVPATTAKSEAAARRRVAGRCGRPLMAGVQVGALGDIHGDFETVRRIQRRHPPIEVWLCVGDVADGEGRYEPFPVPVHFIKGNNEGFDAIADGTLPANVHFLANAVRPP